MKDRVSFRGKSKRLIEKKKVEKKKGVGLTLNERGALSRICARNSKKKAYAVVAFDNSKKGEKKAICFF